MSEPFLSEIRIMSFNVVPKGWALCNGQLLPINQNQPLFSLLGTTYGGNGQTNFALPDLRARTPIHVGQGHQLGEVGGEAAHTLTQSELSQHVHLHMAANTAATTNAPSNTMLLAKSAGANLYASDSNVQAMSPSAVSSIGGSQPHENRQPFITLSFCIALQGIFPSPN
jgi:microcystin-dependent protein